ncbi:hypothetical protein [Roseiarcus fermentans]|uniref:hypothetical protein n=1 Tax=Roseiarcus fermentans TaxID=1473586 RepID=UPI0011BE1A5E|nr:hypothetical protein [Roseiarcus fermentans]
MHRIRNIVTSLIIAEAVLLGVNTIPAEAVQARLASKAELAELMKSKPDYLSGFKTTGGHPVNFVKTVSGGLQFEVKGKDGDVLTMTVTGPVESLRDARMPAYIQAFINGFDKGRTEKLTGDQSGSGGCTNVVINMTMTIGSGATISGGLTQQGSAAGNSGTSTCTSGVIE